MNAAEIEIYEKLHVQIRGVYSELGILSKKSPDGSISKLKLKFVNQLIDASNLLLRMKYKPFDEFKLFDADDVPSDGDVVLVLLQYIKCLEMYRKTMRIARLANTFGQ